MRIYVTSVLVDDLGDVKSTFRLDPVSTEPLAAGKQGVFVRDPDGHAILIRTR